MTRTIFICGRCGSSNVRCDAYAEWDVEKQDWVLSSIYDSTHCEDCEGEQRLEEVPLVDGEPEIRISGWERAAVTAGWSGDDGFCDHPKLGRTYSWMAACRRSKIDEPAP